jgi:hypothetical protein
LPTYKKITAIKTAELKNVQTLVIKEKRLSQKSFRCEQLEKKTTNMLFILIGFYEIAEEPDFWPPFIRK